MLRRTALAMLVPLLLLACTSSLDIAQQLKDAGAALKDLKTVLLDFKFGAGATISVSGVSVDLVSGTGKARLPGDSDLVGRVKQGDNLVEAEIVTLGGDTYFKPTSFFPARKLSADEAKQYPTTARVLDPNSGLAAVIPKGTNPKDSGSEQIDNHDCYKIEADYKPDDVKSALAPFAPADQVHAILWIGKDDHLIRKARISGHVFSANSDSFVEVHLHDFNATVDITKPS
jgi:hypothetical protein